MAKTVNSIAALQKEMQRRINIALEGEAKQVVEDTIKKHVQDDVLGAYEPVMYERRGSGGIDDETNIKSTVRDHVLTVKDVAPLEGPRVPGIQPAEPARLNSQNCWKDMAKALLTHGDPAIRIGVSTAVCYKCERRSGTVK